MEYPAIYLTCQRSDYFLAQVAVASIRYYYPKVEIFLVKDEINGEFDTRELEKYFQVKIYDLGKKRYGWTSAKMFLLLSRELPQEPILILDADTVFVGKLLDEVKGIFKDYAFIVCPEYNDKPGDPEFTRFYYDYDYFKILYPELEFPGHTFNTGCIVATPGLIRVEDVASFFNTAEYPYWTELADEYLPTRDQSLLNILLPLKERKQLLTYGLFSVMVWFADPKVRKLSISDVVYGEYKYLVHWAGSRKSSYLQVMTRGDILVYFQKYYYYRLPYGRMRFHYRQFIEAMKHLFYYMPRKVLGVDKDAPWIAD